MERVGILISKLQEQFNQGSDVQKMIVLVEMLYGELLQEKGKSNGSDAVVSITTPYNTPPVTSINAAEKIAAPVEDEPKEEAKETEKSYVPVAPVMEKISTEDAASSFVFDTSLEKPQPAKWYFDPSDIPTLAHQEKIVYELKAAGSADGSMNDKLKVEKIEMGTVLHETPIRDLKKAISINDRHRFIDILFRGDETMYERSIKTINNFTIFAEAEFWMQRELKLKLGWDTNLPEVKLFDQLIKRRFS